MYARGVDEFGVWHVHINQHVLKLQQQLLMASGSAESLTHLHALEVSCSVSKLGCY